MTQTCRQQLMHRCWKQDNSRQTLILIKVLEQIKVLLYSSNRMLLCNHQRYHRWLLQQRIQMQLDRMNRLNLILATMIVRSLTEVLVVMIIQLLIEGSYFQNYFTKKKQRFQHF